MVPFWGKEKYMIEQIRKMIDGRADLCIEAVEFEPDRDLLDQAKAGH